MSDKKGTRYKKYCIAYIPTSECSYFCKDLLSSKESSLVKCTFVPSRNKWTPFENAKNRKIPDKLEDLKD